MKSLNVSSASRFVICVMLLFASLFSGTCLAGISIGDIYGPLSLDSAWPPQSEVGPCWSPDGTMIVFSWGDGYTASDPLFGKPNPEGSYIVIMTSDGQAIRGPDNPLVNDPYWDNHSPDWSPDGNWIVIVYAGSRVGPAYIARVSLIDGTVVPIPGTIGGHPKQPKWSPDGTKIAYLGGGWGGSPSYHICITDPDGSSHEDLTPSVTGYGVTGLSWSPDGTQIVFTQESQPGLLVLDVATKVVTSLPGFPPTLTPSTPVWASQNSILFVADGAIYCYQINTQTATQLTYGPGDGLGDWHPTAGLVFSSSRGCTVRWDSNIYIGTPGPANQPPVADAGPDQTVEQESYAGTEVTLDGSGSSDDGLVQPLTYTWTWAGGSASDVNPSVIFPLGMTTVTLTVSDGELSDTDIVDITVEDTTPPTINSISASPDILWPPNHKMVEVTVMVDCKDICDPAPFCYILGVTSNETINGPGDGNTEPDWDFTDNPLVVLLRAERAGVGTGRVYTIHIECMDASENIASGIVEVTVPHDQGKGKGKK